MSLKNRFGFNDYIRHTQSKRIRENAITAIVIITMLTSCIIAIGLVFISWFGVY